MVSLYAPSVTLYFRICRARTHILVFFFFNDTATTEIYTLSLHDALPIWRVRPYSRGLRMTLHVTKTREAKFGETSPQRSEEHTSELQSHLNLVCRLLLEKKKKKRKITAEEGKGLIDIKRHEGDNVSMKRE